MARSTRNSARLPGRGMCSAVWLLAAAVACTPSVSGDAPGDSAGQGSSAEGSAGPGSAAVDEDEEAIEPHATEEDGLLALRVHAELARSQDVDAAAFRVQAIGGVVTLVARTEDEAMAAQARTVAGTVDGVGEVRVESAESARSGEAVRVAEASADAERLAAYRALGTRRATEPVFEAPERAVALNRAASGDRPRTYRVRAGDSLSAISSRTLRDGNQWRRIYELNRSVIGPDPARLAEGMELRIPQD